MRLLLLLLCVLTFASPLPADDAELDRLRDDHARRFFTPEAHLRLAKYLADHGQPLVGFCISEAARTDHFGEKGFAQAVRVVYRNDRFDNSAAAEARLRAELPAEQGPSPAKLAALADIHLSREEWARAEELLRKAVALAPDSYDYVSSLARVLQLTEREAEGDALREEWLAAHPESIEAARAQASRSVEHDVETAAAMIDAALAKFPDDAWLHFQKAGLFHDLKKYDAAAVEYELAAALDPKSAYIQGWTARFFLKAMKDQEKALRYYLAAYFLDPDFYDTDFAEARITTIATDRGTAAFAARRKARVPVETLLADDDPVIVRLALEQTSLFWKAHAYAVPVARLLKHDDPNIRYRAATILSDRVTKEHERRMRELIAGECVSNAASEFAQLGRTIEGRCSVDLYARGAVAFMAARWFGPFVVPMLEPLLAHPADLLRYEAVGLLAEFGGAGGKARLRKLRDSGTLQDARLIAIVKAAVGK